MLCECRKCVTIYESAICRVQNVQKWPYAKTLCIANVLKIEQLFLMKEKWAGISLWLNIIINYCERITPFECQSYA